jgi:hypothetical protein
LSSDFLMLFVMFWSEASALFSIFCLSLTINNFSLFVKSHLCSIIRYLSPNVSSSINSCKHDLIPMQQFEILFEVS